MKTTILLAVLAGVIAVAGNYYMEELRCNQIAMEQFDKRSDTYDEYMRTCPKSIDQCYKDASSAFAKSLDEDIEVLKKDGCG